MNDFRIGGEGSSRANSSRPRRFPAPKRTVSRKSASSKADGSAPARNPLTKSLPTGSFPAGAGTRAASAGPGSSHASLAPTGADTRPRNLPAPPKGEGGSPADRGKASRPKNGFFSGSNGWGNFTRDIALAAVTTAGVGAGVTAATAGTGLAAAALAAVGLATAPVWLVGMGTGLAVGATVAVASRLVFAATREGGLGSAKNRQDLRRGLWDDGGLVGSSVAGAGFARYARFGRPIANAFAGAGVDGVMSGALSLGGKAFGRDKRPLDAQAWCEAGVASITGTLGSLGGQALGAGLGRLAGGFVNREGWPLRLARTLKGAEGVQDHSPYKGLAVPPPNTGPHAVIRTKYSDDGAFSEIGIQGASGQPPDVIATRRLLTTNAIVGGALKKHLAGASKARGVQDLPVFRHFTHHVTGEAMYVPVDQAISISSLTSEGEAVLLSLTPEGFPTPKAIPFVDEVPVGVLKPNATDRQVLWRMRVAMQAGSISNVANTGHADPKRVATRLLSHFFNGSGDPLIVDKFLIDKEIKFLNAKNMRDEAGVNSYSMLGKEVFNAFHGIANNNMKQFSASVRIFGATGDGVEYGDYLAKSVGSYHLSFSFHGEMQRIKDEFLFKGKVVAFLQDRYNWSDPEFNGGIRKSCGIPAVTGLMMPDSYKKVFGDSRIGSPYSTVIMSLSDLDLRNGVNGIKDFKRGLDQKIQVYTHDYFGHFQMLEGGARPYTTYGISSPHHLEMRFGGDGVMREEINLVPMNSEASS